MTATRPATPDAGAVARVLADNPRARRFHERAGFAPDGTARTEVVGGRELAEVRYTRSG